ncbi:V-type ATPase subunit [Aerococcus sp. UMB1112A]|uniref:V-type ATPase subunit n=1 Tax=unclassified Aerococcus TaxID=2618060 RepID=UPI00254A5100|nr:MULTISPECIES: V-type ATPase subunit [unclassified Aerococcus]MDK6804659.1 V-type ATPase subunit [Aerococcus sp. UMB7834]MDK8503030.1 V-type ATPase subunit [Aerococcus sp. UMB1112A]
MENTAYAGLNVSVRVQETSLLQASDYNAMLQATSLSEALNVLRKTDYNLPEDIEETRDFDAFLMADLRRAYNDLYASTPDPRVVDFYALRYEYHNLKVLFKEWYAERDFSDIYLPIGRHSIESLRRAVRTGDGEGFDQSMIQGIRDVRENFENYHSYDAISIILDSAYLDNMRELADEIDDPGVDRLADMTIDFANLSMLVRAIQQGRSKGFMRAVLSDKGTLDSDEIINYAVSHNHAAIAQAYKSLIYGGNLANALHEDGSTSVVELEGRIEETEAEEMKLAQLEAFGPLPALAYLYFKENEITNIRLILVGKANDLDEQAIKERMRPIYGS